MTDSRHRTKGELLRAAGFLAGLALAPGLSRAQGPGPGEVSGLARPPAPAASEMPAALVLPEIPATDEARSLARAGRHAEAAERLVAAFQATGDDRMLYHAGLEYAVAGQHARALHRFLQLLERSAASDPALRQHVEGLVSVEKTRISTVRLRLIDGRSGQPMPPQVLARTHVSARPLTPGAPASATITLSGYNNEPMWLEPGPWLVQIRPPGYRPVELRRSAMFGLGEDTWEVVTVPEQVAVALNLTPARVLRGATLRLSPTDGAPVQPIERPVERGDVRLVLTGGSWQVDVNARRHEAHVPFMVSPGMAPVVVRMQRTATRPRGRKFERNEPLEISLGATVLTELLVGAGLGFAGAVKRGRRHDRNEELLQGALVDDASGDADGKPGLEQVESVYPTARYHRDITLAMNLETAGIVVLTSALGTAIPGLTVSARARHRAVYIELGVGAALLAGGAAWMSAVLRERAALLGPDEPTARVTQTELRPLTAHNLGASTLTGLGIGLTATSLVVLLSEATKRRRERRRQTSAAPLAAPGFAGFVLRGNF